VNGHDVMEIFEIEPSEEIGRTLNRLLKMVIEDPSLNTRENLLRILETIRDEEFRR